MAHSIYKTKKNPECFDANRVLGWLVLSYTVILDERAGAGNDLNELAERDVSPIVAEYVIYWLFLIRLNICLFCETMKVYEK